MTAKERQALLEKLLASAKAAKTMTPVEARAKLQVEARLNDAALSSTGEKVG